MKIFTFEEFLYEMDQVNGVMTNVLKITKIDERTLKFKYVSMQDNLETNVLSERLYDLSVLPEDEMYIVSLIKRYVLTPTYNRKLIKRFDGGGLHFNVYVPKRKEDECLAIIRDTPVIFENIEPIVFKDRNISFSRELLPKYYPDFNYSNEASELLRIALIGMDPNESLAYLEPQIDFLTKIMKIVVEKVPGIKEQILEEFPQYEGFMREIQTSSVFTIKDEKHCLDEIKVIKNRVRNEQQNYYREKEKLKK